MRHVQVFAPSFPQVTPDVLLQPQDRQVWQVVCGDADHWRAGLYSPEATCAADVTELEKHTCPELFLLIRGRLTLLLSDGQGGTRELELQQGQPVLIETSHTGFCPDGPFTGTAFVVERDLFATEYRAPEAWK
jgi:hypothetical protein